ncbi:hypothetical protein TNCV_576591 [Trichonephila clavipes]|nr:hypothetical protein TNCV_576591 [Trichonephila clavipes]
MMVDKGNLKFGQNSKNSIDSDGENEMNNEASVPTSFEMRNIMKMAQQRTFRPPPAKSGFASPSWTYKRKGDDEYLNEPLGPVSDGPKRATIRSTCALWKTSRLDIIRLVAGFASRKNRKM